MFDFNGSLKIQLKIALEFVLKIEFQKIIHKFISFNFCFVEEHKKVINRIIK
jgi:hypothetical protein